MYINKLYYEYNIFDKTQRRRNYVRWFRTISETVFFFFCFFISLFYFFNRTIGYSHILTINTRTYAHILRATLVRLLRTYAKREWVSEWVREREREKEREKIQCNGVAQRVSLEFCYYFSVRSDDEKKMNKLFFRVVRA